MLTLGIKEAIINDGSSKGWEIKFTDLSGVVTPVAASDIMTIAGYGSFYKTTLSNPVSQPGTPPILGDSTFDLSFVPVDKELVTVSVLVKTSRYQSEFANDFIVQGRPYLFHIMGNGTDALSVSLPASMLEWEAKFDKDKLPFTLIGGTFTVRDPSLDINYIRYKSSITPEVLLEATAVTLSDQGNGQGKLLEESVRMGFGEATNPYGMESGTAVDIKAIYNEVYWQLNTTEMRKVAYVLDKAPLTKEIEFDLFIKNGALDSAGNDAFTAVKTFLGI